MGPMARVLLGVTGGIAAYKACELLRLLVKDGHDVVPLVTPGAERFVTRETFAALARKPLDDDPYPHLAHADLLVVAHLSRLQPELVAVRGDPGVGGDGRRPTVGRRQLGEILTTA